LFAADDRRIAQSIEGFERKLPFGGAQPIFGGKVFEYRSQMRRRQASGQNDLSVGHNNRIPSDLLQHKHGERGAQCLSDRKSFICG
jgi:hypothetical protein